MLWGLGLIALLSCINAHSQDFEISSGLQICQNINKPEEGCEYNVINADPLYLIQEATRRVFQVSNGSVPDSEGYIRLGKNPKTIVFKVKVSPEENSRGINEKRDQLIEFFRSNDTSPGVFDLDAINFKVAFYVISMTKAKTMGLNLNFTISGIIPKDLPRATGDQSGFSLNLGNLTSHMYNIFFQAASSSGIIVDSEQYTFTAYNGSALPFMVKRNLYRDNNTSGITQTETMQKYVSGKLFINPKNPNLITIHGLEIGYWLPANDGVSIAEKYVSYQDIQPLVLGEQSVFTLESNKTAVTKNTGLFFLNNDTAEVSLKILASISAESPKLKSAVQNNIYFNPRTGLYNFKDDYLAKQTNYHSIDEIIDPQNLAVSVIPSPAGIFGSTIAIQFDPILATKSNAQSFVNLKITGEGIDISQTLQLQNLMAGPYLIQGFDVKTVNKFKNEKMNFTISLERTPSLVELGGDSNLFKKDFRISYFPALYKACIENKKDNKCN